MTAQPVTPIVNEEPKAAKAISKYLRTSPRKVRLVLDVVRYKPAVEAMRILGAMPRKGARLAEKVLKSAMANAKVLGMDETKLYVAAIFANGGPTFKRFMSRSMGRADQLLKRTTHISVVLKEGQKSYGPPSGLTEDKAKESAAPEAKKSGKRKLAGAKG